MAKNNEVKYSTLLPPKESVKPGVFDIFDRIINLKISTAKFPVKDEGTGEISKVADEFIIRSDYELVFPQMLPGSALSKSKAKNTYTIKRCAHKPSIKVQYTEVSNGTMLGIDIFISNFFIITKDGRSLMSFNQQTYDIASIELQMGYIGQFNNLLGLDKRTIEDLTPDDLFNFKPGFGVDTLIINNVEYVTTDKLPPDYTLHIHGYVGNTLESAPIITSKYSSFKKIPKDAYFKVDGGNSPYEQIFYNYITRRYLNKNVYDPKIYASIAKADDNGMYSTEVADDYGIKVICSKGVKDLQITTNLKDNEDNEITIENYLDLGGYNNSVNSALKRITEYTGKSVLFRRLNNGDFLAFTKEEITGNKVENLFSDLMDIINANQANEYFNNILPAVYNISIDAMATIVCPFFAWVNPFQELKFASRYALTSSTAFYADFSPSISRFYAINVQVTFATTEDINEMQIVAVSNRS